ncbi:MAG: hypothetical protein SFV21_07305 [Rhodospirillaceae bacterium]|nr:hypothetical protein [Rhodospirillaceae bacterium]
MSTRAAKLFPAIVLAIGGAAGFGALMYNFVAHAPLGWDEIQNLIRAEWSAAGAVRPYTAADTPWTMPLYRLMLQGWQALAGTDPTWARALSAGLAGLTAVVVAVLTRRISGSLTAAAAAGAMFAVAPGAMFAMSAIAPTAALALLQALALMMVVAALGRPRAWLTVLFALGLAAMFFLGRAAILTVIALAPLYVAAIGRQRLAHVGVIVLTIAAATAGLLAMYPARLAGITMWGPVSAQLLDLVGLAPRALAQIDASTTGPNALNLAWGRDAGAVLVDALLPYAGTWVAALSLFVAAGRGVRVLWLAPILLVWLTASSAFALLVDDREAFRAMLAVAAVVGALGAALTLAMVGRAMRARGWPSAPAIVGGALAVIAANTFAPGLALRPEAQFYPAPALRYPGTGSEAADLRAIQQLLVKETAAGQAIVLIHDAPVLPYAVHMAGRRFPAQSLAPAVAFRTIRADITGARRETVLAAIENHTLWTTETLVRWLARDADMVLAADGSAVLADGPAAETLAANFTAVGTVTVAGQPHTLYKRTPRG